MFPYPSGAGLHVGHPLGFIGTDVFARYHRMTGRNVLHTMGFDAFGLPAEQYAVQTGQHPRKTTEDNIQRYLSQIRRLGLGHDERRRIATTDLTYYRWTQWIFLQIYNAWYDETAGRARPIAELEAEFARAERSTPDGRGWGELTRAEQRKIIDSYRLVYQSEAPVNWCPGPGHRGGQRGGHRRRPQRPRQLPGVPQEPAPVDDADHRLRRPPDRRPGPAGLAGEGQGHAAQLDRPLVGRADPLPRRRTVRSRSSPPGRTPCSARPTWCWPPNTRWWTGSPRPRGPTDTDARWTAGAATPAEAIAAYRRAASQKSDLDRQENKDKTGVFIGAYATNPANGKQIPVFIADYVLMGYGTGAIMAVPGQDQRDWDFATVFGLPIVRTVRPADGLRRRGVHRRRPGDELWVPGRAGHRPRPRRRSSRGWRRTATARASCSTSCATGCSPASATGASRSRSSTTRTTCRSRCRTACCRSSCPRSTTTRPAPTTRTTPTPSRRRRCPAPRDWVEVELDLGDGHEDVPPRRQRDAAVGRFVLVPAALRRPDQRRAVLRAGERGVLAGPAPGRPRPARPGRRRPVHRRHRARRAAPAVLPLLAEGPVRPGPRVRARAVPAAVQPGLHPGLRLHRRARRLRAGRGGVRSGRQVLLERRTGPPGVRQDGQEPEERRHAGRDVRAVRRGHLPVLRDGDGPDGRLAAVGDQGRRRRAAVPAAAVAQRGRRGDRRAADRRRRRRTRPRCARCTRPSTACTRTTRTCASTRRARS